MSALPTCGGDLAGDLKQSKDKAALYFPAKNLLSKLQLIPESVTQYRKRWFWELLQNAVDYNATQVSLEITGNKLDFQHDAKPFTTDDLLCLTRGGSWKDADEERDVKGLIGQFGTGFLSTHVLSAVINVTGPVHRDADPEGTAQRVNLTLDRSGYRGDDGNSDKNRVSKVHSVYG